MEINISGLYYAVYWGKIFFSFVSSSSSFLPSKLNLVFHKQGFDLSSNYQMKQ